MADLAERVAMTVCRNPEGLFLVHRRPEDAPEFPGFCDAMVGGPAVPNESYQDAASRGLTEALGVSVPVRFLFKFRCGSYVMAVHEAQLDGEEITADPERIAWTGWMTAGALQRSARKRPFVPDGQEAMDRYFARGDWKVARPAG